MLPLSTAQSTVMSVKLSCTQSDLCYSTIIAHGRKNLPTTYLMSLWDPSMEQRLVNWLDASSCHFSPRSTAKILAYTAMTVELPSMEHHGK